MDNGSLLVGLLILVIFALGAGLMISRKLPALLALPLMGLAIALGAWAIQAVGWMPGAPAMDLRRDILRGVLALGSFRLAEAMIAALFGGMLSFIMQKSGVAENMIKHGAELIGDNPLMVAFLSMLLVAAIFTTIGGLGAIIMVAIVVMPMLATVGVPPPVAGGILLIGLSMGGVMNAQAWALYINVLGLPQKEVRTFAMVMFLLMGVTGLVFIIVELMRARALQSMRQALMLLAVVGGAATLAIGAIVVSHRGATAPLPVFEPVFAGQWRAAQGSGSVEFDEGRAVVRYGLEARDTPVGLLDADNIGAWLALPGFEALRDRDLADFKDFTFSARANFAGALRLAITRADGTGDIFVRTLTPGAVLNFTLTPAELGVASLADLRGAALTAVAETPRPGAQAFEIAFSQARYSFVPVVPLWLKVLRIGFGLVLIGLLGLIVWDLLVRVRTWRKQIVSVKWYAYLIPVLPLGLIIIYDLDVNAGLAMGFAYAVLATLRPGSKSMAVQSMIQGSASVLPAVLLMVGIGILVCAVIGPPGFGAGWPVTSSMRPLLEAALPKNPLSYVIVFGVCAPLALYRGPLNVWGLGFGVAALFLTADVVPAAAIMAMLLSVGQVQGICDPTNTHNVWIANELRVDVQALMLKTLPYIWVLAVAGLALGALMYF